MREENLEIKQIPTPEHPQAVVVSTIRDENGVRQGIGAFCNNSSSESYDPQVLIDKARNLAVERALNNSNNLSDKPEYSQSRPQETKSASDKQNNGHKHKTTPGSVSEKQLTSLGKMAQERHQNLADITNGKFGCTPEEMSSKQANELFTFFK